MKDTNGSEDWRVLCELASKEKDPEKLIDLVVKINRVLEECQQKPIRKCVFVPRCSSTLAACCIRFLVSQPETRILVS